MLMFLVIARVSFGGGGGGGGGGHKVGSKCIITHVHVFIQSMSIFNDNSFCFHTQRISSRSFSVILSQFSSA